MTEALIVLDEGIHSDLTGCVPDISHAAEQHQTVSQVRAAFKSQIIDGGGGHCEPGVPACTGSGYFVDP